MVFIPGEFQSLDNDSAWSPVWSDQVREHTNRVDPVRRWGVRIRRVDSWGQAERAAVATRQDVVIIIIIIIIIIID